MCCAANSLGGKIVAPFVVVVALVVVLLCCIVLGPLVVVQVWMFQVEFELVLGLSLFSGVKDIRLKTMKIVAELRNTILKV